MWDERSPLLVLFHVRAPLDINDSNVDEYIQRLSQLDKFIVEKRQKEICAEKKKDTLGRKKR